MKIKEITLSTLAIALTLSFSACSVFKSLGSSTSDNSEQSSNKAQIDITPVTLEETPQLPEMTEEEEEGTPTALPGTALASALEGEWYIIQVGDIEIDRDENMPYIYFTPATGQFYANNGCNTLNGSYTLTKRDVATFANVLTTMQYCPDVEFDSSINAVLSDGFRTKLSISESEGETLLNFIDGRGNVIMQLRRGKLNFLNGHWAIDSVEGIDTLTAEADIFIDLNELKFHGNTGCNYFNGTIYLDHRIANAVDLSDIASTRMACPNSQQETAIFVALEQVDTAKNNGDSTVSLLDSDGNVLITLRSIPMKK